MEPVPFSEHFGRRPGGMVQKEFGSPGEEVWFTRLQFRGALIVFDGFERTAAARLPTIYQWPETAEEGGLIAYGPRFLVIYRQHASQAIKVLRGTNPADIPVEQPTKFELVINLKTARALELTIPPILLERADVVIE